MINIVICDDNYQYLELLKGVVEKECSSIFSDKEDYSVSGAFCSGESLLKHINDHHIDVVFLDIDMPNMNGFEVAKIICKAYKETKIIFMSAYDNFVYSSFEFYPFAYLRKSHMSEELPAVLKRVVNKIRESNQKVSISTVTGPKVIDISTITYVESNRNYVSVHTIHEKNYTCRGTLTEFERNLNDCDFFRIHSAFLINFQHVERMLDNGFVLVYNTSLPIAQRRVQEFNKNYLAYLRRCFGT